MTKRLTLAILVLMLAAASAHRGTPQEAKAMLAKAAAHYKSAGRAQALKDFNARSGPFIDRDLYVFCIASDAITVANGGFPQYVGTSVNAAAAPTPADFWRRWNRPAAQWFHEHVFLRAGGIRFPLRATLATFAVSAHTNRVKDGFCLSGRSWRRGAEWLSRHPLRRIPRFARNDSLVQNFV